MQRTLVLGSPTAVRIGMGMARGGRDGRRERRMPKGTDRTWRNIPVTLPVSSAALRPCSCHSILSGQKSSRFKPAAAKARFTLLTDRTGDTVALEPHRDNQRMTLLRRVDRSQLEKALSTGTRKPLLRTLFHSPARWCESSCSQAYPQVASS